MEVSKEFIRSSINKVEKWVEDHNYKGYEPFDGLSSTFRPLTFGNLLMDRLLLQLIRQSPLNIRPLFGVKPVGFNNWPRATWHGVIALCLK